MRRPVSLRALAVGWLARREHSERELRRKLSSRLQRDQAIAAGTGTAESPDAGHAVTDHLAEIDAVVAWLKTCGYLDERRFVESRVHARSARFGAARIEQELSMHGVEVDRAAMQSLRQSEYERARALWQRRFGQAPADARTAARQARFLAGRGFAADVIRRVLRHPPDESNAGADEAG